MGVLVSEGNRNYGGVNKGFQLKSVRVEKVILTRKQLEEEDGGDGKGWSTIGTIYYSDTKGSQADGIVSEGKWLPARPLLPRITDYPLIGEIVLILSSFSKEAAVKGKSTDTYAYYFPSLNIWNKSHHNSVPGHYKVDQNGTVGNADSYQFSADGGRIKTTTDADDTENLFPLGEYFNESNIRSLLPYEGDHILEGRFGNSIRFGSTTPYEEGKDNNPEPNPWSFYSHKGISKLDNTEGKIGDPIIIIRNGQQIFSKDDQNYDPFAPVVENINEDNSSIYMTSNQRLSNLVVAGATAASSESVSQLSYGDQLEKDILDNTKNYTVPFLFGSTIDINVQDMLKTGMDAINLDDLVDTGAAAVQVLEDYLGIELIGDPIIPTSTETVTTEREGEDDGLSFYDELTESGVADDSDFDEYDLFYEAEELASQTYDESTNQATSAQEIPNSAPLDGTNGQNTPSTPYDGDANADWTTYHHMYLTDKDKVKKGKNQAISQVTGKRGLGQRKEVYTALGLYDDTVDPKGPFPGKNGTVTYVPVGKDWSVMKKNWAGTAGRVKFLVIHYTAGGKKDAYKSTVSSIYGWRGSYACGGDRAGYHWMIEGHDGSDGKCTNIYQDSFTAYGAGVGSKFKHFSYYKGNSVAVNINWMGGVSGKLNMSDAQASTLNKMVKFYCSKYPNIKVIGHYNVSDKACPGFHVSHYLTQLGLSKHKQTQVGGKDLMREKWKPMHAGGDYEKKMKERAEMVAKGTPTKSTSKDEAMSSG
tara:strand:- start:11889 stop:14162 length:2274 start_codon:yes stop_codon:yes gene_type:complete